MAQGHKRRPPAWRYVIPAVILSGILCYALTRAAMIYFAQESAQREFEELKQETQETQEAQAAEESGEASDGTVVNNGLQQLKDANPDFVGWLTIEDTIVDYPVMKSAEDDPEFYLRRNFDREYSPSGCLFIGAGCTEESDSFIVYGHKMSNDTMFGTLDAYTSYDFANTHQVIYFDTPTQNRAYRVFAAFGARILEPGEQGFRYYESVGDLTKEQYDSMVDAIRSMSIIDIKNVPTYPQQIMLLSTCSYHTDNGRFVVAAYRE